MKWHKIKFNVRNCTILRSPEENEIFSMATAKNAFFSVHRRDLKIVQLTNDTLLHGYFIHIQFVIVPVPKT